MKLDPKQSHYVLQVLLAQRRVRAAQVRAVLGERQREIVSLRKKLAALEELSNTPKSAPAAAARPRRARRMSPKLRAFRRQQGKYMGFIRGLKSSEKARVRAVREKQGLLPAIRLAASLARA
jgi:glycyl-tRNA synthetase beta subunit